MTAETLAPLIRVNESGVFLSCHVQPGAKRTAVAGVYGTALKISLAAPPVDGKANKETSMCPTERKLQIMLHFLPPLTNA